MRDQWQLLQRNAEECRLTKQQWAEFSADVRRVEVSRLTCPATVALTSFTTSLQTMMAESEQRFSQSASGLTKVRNFAELDRLLGQYRHSKDLVDQLTRLTIDKGTQLIHMLQKEVCDTIGS